MLSVGKLTIVNRYFEILAFKIWLFEFKTCGEKNCQGLIGTVTEKKNFLLLPLTNRTHVQVSEFAPSFSAVIGSGVPQKYVSFYVTGYTFLM